MKGAVISCQGKEIYCIYRIAFPVHNITRTNIYELINCIAHHYGIMYRSHHISKISNAHRIHRSYDICLKTQPICWESISPKMGFYPTECSIPCESAAKMWFRIYLGIK